MGDRRIGIGANLTPNQAKEQLAVPCFLVLVNAAKVDFVLSYTPTTGRPVYIRRTARTLDVIQSIPGAGGLYFNVVAINSCQYDTAVRPVLQDPLFCQQTAVAKARLATGNVKDVVDGIGEGLRLSFIQAGYGPPDTP